jgi:hypothetical protein
VDVFYVTDLTGAKITSDARREAIAKHLMDVLRPAKAQNAESMVSGTVSP